MAAGQEMVAALAAARAAGSAGWAALGLAVAVAVAVEAGAGSATAAAVMPEVRDSAADLSLVAVAGNSERSFAARGLKTQRIQLRCFQQQPLLGFQLRRIHQHHWQKLHFHFLQPCLHNPTQVL